MGANPIQSIDGKTIPCPSSYNWTLEDLSAEGSGRTEDIVMQKNRIGQTRSLQVAWNNITIEDAALILQTVNPEYISVTFLDAMAGGYITKECYIGNRNSPLYNTDIGLWESVSFSIIQRDGK